VKFYSKNVSGPLTIIKQKRVVNAAMSDCQQSAAASRRSKNNSRNSKQVPFYLSPKLQWVGGSCSGRKVKFIYLSMLNYFIIQQRLLTSTETVCKIAVIKINRSTGLETFWSTGRDFISTASCRGVCKVQLINVVILCVRSSSSDSAARTP